MSCPFHICKQAPVLMETLLGFKAEFSKNQPSFVLSLLVVLKHPPVPGIQSPTVLHVSDIPV